MSDPIYLPLRFTSSPKLGFVKSLPKKPKKDKTEIVPCLILFHWQIRITKQCFQPKHCGTVLLQKKSVAQAIRNKPNKSEADHYYLLSKLKGKFSYFPFSVT